MSNATPTNGTRRVVIDPVTRVEGHGKVTIHLDESGQVDRARFHVVEFRGFERFIQGRPFWEMPVAVQRLCGICPVSHHLCAAKAMDRVVGGEVLTPTAEKIRRLMHYGQIFQSHALHFFHLASPDLLFGFEADPLQRNVLAVAQHHPELARQGILMRKFGQEVIAATAGRKIHGTAAVPGGIQRNLAPEVRDELLAQIPQMLQWAREGMALARDYTLEHLGELADFGTFDSNFLSMVRPDGALDLYDGVLRAVDADGGIIFDQLPAADYLDVIAEEVRPWSYMKFPFIRSLGPRKGWYRVGPLARLNTCDFIDTPLAEEGRKEFRAVGEGRPVNLSMAYHWARMIETLHAAEVMERLLGDGDLQGTDLTVQGERRREGVGILEAPRGTLFHHYHVGEDDLVKRCNLIVSTTSNNEPMNRAVEAVARKVMGGRPEITEGMMNQVEVVIRAYDPCLSCATHALGQMPLAVEVHDALGDLVDRRLRSAKDVAPEQAQSKPVSSVRVLAYGNPGRCDDGLGPLLGASLEALGLPHVDVSTTMQLQVEEAEKVAQVDVVLFLDASVDGKEPFTVSPVLPKSADETFTTHSVTPESVLGLAHELYGASTRGFVVAVRGYDFGGFDESLSPGAERNLAAARDHLAAALRPGGRFGPPADAQEEVVP